MDVRSGTHYVVDCNYLSNYDKVPTDTLIEKVDGVIREKSKKRSPKMSRMGVAAIGVALVGLFAGITYFAVKRR